MRIFIATKSSMMENDSKFYENGVNEHQDSYNQNSILKIEKLLNTKRNSISNGIKPLLGDTDAIKKFLYIRKPKRSKSVDCKFFEKKSFVGFKQSEQLKGGYILRNKISNKKIYKNNKHKTKDKIRSMSNTVAYNYIISRNNKKEKNKIGFFDLFHDYDEKEDKNKKYLFECDSKNRFKIDQKGGRKSRDFGNIFDLEKGCRNIPRVIPMVRPLDM